MRSNEPGAETSWQDAIQELTLAGRKIDAIKLLREQTGAGLKDAKDYVDALAAGGPPPTLPAGSQTGRTRNNGFGCVAVIALAVVAWMIYVLW